MRRGRKSPGGIGLAPEPHRQECVKPYADHERHESPDEDLAHCMDAGVHTALGDEDSQHEGKPAGDDVVRHIPNAHKAEEGQRAVSADEAAIQTFEGVQKSIEAIASSMAKTLDKIQPDKASVEFGIEVAFKEGVLTGLLVKGSTTGNLTVTLEWEKNSKSKDKSKDGGSS